MILYPWMYRLIAVGYVIIAAIGYTKNVIPIIVLGVIGMLVGLLLAHLAKDFHKRNPLK